MPIQWLIFAVLATIAVVVRLPRGRRKREGDPPASIVLLLERPRALSVQILSYVLGNATGRNVSAIALDDNSDAKNDDQAAGICVSGASPHFIAQLSGTLFAIHNLPSPYMDDPVRASESFRELRLRKAVRDHKAWLSMDIVYLEAATPEACRVVAQTFARLIDTDCLALYYPASEAITRDQSL